MSKKVFILFMCLIVTTVTIILQSQLFAQDPFIEGDTDSGLSSTDAGPHTRTVKTNPFFRSRSILARLGLFLVFWAVFVALAWFIFNRALISERDPSSAFFTGNLIVCLASAIFFFLCFSEYTYSGNATGLGDHFAKVEWHFYITLIAFLIILVLLGKKRSRQHQTQGTSIGGTQGNTSE